MITTNTSALSRWLPGSSPSSPQQSPPPPPPPSPLHTIHQSALTAHFSSSSSSSAGRQPWWTHRFSHSQSVRETHSRTASKRNTLVILTIITITTVVLLLFHRPVKWARRASWEKEREKVQNCSTVFGSDLPHFYHQRSTIYRVTEHTPPSPPQQPLQPKKGAKSCVHILSPSFSKNRHLSDTSFPARV